MDVVPVEGQRDLPAGPRSLLLGLGSANPRRAVGQIRLSVRLGWHQHISFGCFANGDEEGGCANAWPPRPQDIVNIDTLVQTTTWPPTVVYSVPANRYLVITDIVSAMSVSGSTADLIEDFVTSINVKLDAQFLVMGSSSPGRVYKPTLGLVFSPGSNVAFFSNGGPAGFRVNITGYLVDV